MSALKRLLTGHYEASDFPALSAQSAAWADNRPLDGVQVLDATPVFRNTVAKHLALVSAGAHVTVGADPGIPHDDTVVGLLRDAGLRVVESASAAQRHRFDVVVDCAGLHRDVPSRHGFVELTRSGADEFTGCRQPVLLVDSGRIKLIETSLGTGDGFVRALAHYGHSRLAGRTVVVFGGGKVGSGVARSCTAAGAEVAVVDHPAAALPSRGWRVVDRDDNRAVMRLISAAWCVVTATGTAAALAEWDGELRASSALLANMGVADEFGPGMPTDRVLNGKAPVNFALAEPTRMRYMDPVMALSNAAAAAVVAGEVPTGIHPPTAELEDAVLALLGDSPVAAEAARLTAAGTDQIPLRHSRLRADGNGSW